MGYMGGEGEWAITGGEVEWVIREGRVSGLYGREG